MLHDIDGPMYRYWCMIGEGRRAAYGGPPKPASAIPYTIGAWLVLRDRQVALHLAWLLSEHVREEECQGRWASAGAAYRFVQALDRT